MPIHVFLFTKETPYSYCFITWFLYQWFFCFLFLLHFYFLASSKPKFYSYYPIWPNLICLNQYPSARLCIPLVIIHWNLSSFNTFPLFMILTLWRDKATYIAKLAIFWTYLSTAHYTVCLFSTQYFCRLEITFCPEGFILNICGWSTSHRWLCIFCQETQHVLNCTISFRMLKLN